MRVVFPIYPSRGRGRHLGCGGLSALDSRMHLGTDLGTDLGARFSTDEAGLAWQRIESEPLFARAPQALAMAEGVEVLVYTDDAAIAAHLNELGAARNLALRAELLTPPPGEGLDESGRTAVAMPRGSSLVLSLYTNSDEICLADYRNPLLTPATLARLQARRAESAGGTEAKPVLTVLPSEDHPVQMYAHYRVHTGATLARLLPGTARDLRDLRNLQDLGSLPQGFGADEVRVSEPFFLDLAFHGLAMPPGEFLVRLARAELPESPFFVEYAELGDYPEQLYQRLGLFQALSAVTARRIYPLEELWTSAGEVAALPPHAIPGAPEAALIRTATGELELFARLAEVSAPLGRPLKLRLWPVRGGRIIEAEASERMVVSRMHPRVGTCTLAGVSLAGPLAVLTPEEEEAAREGLVLGLLERAGENEHDLAEPMACDGTLWSHDPETGYVTNTITGALVAGRQSFPEVFEPEGSLILGGVDQLRAISRLLAEGKALGVVLEHDEALRVLTDIDLLRLLTLAGELAAPPNEPTKPNEGGEEADPGDCVPSVLINPVGGLR